MSTPRFYQFCAALMLTGMVVPSASAQSYYDWLIDQPGLYSTTALNLSSEVVDNLNFSDKSKATTIHDPNLDAAQFFVQEGKGSIHIGDQVRHYWPYVDSGNILVYWEARMPEYWARDGSVDGVNTYKAFQLSRNDGDLALEFRFRFSQVDKPYVARVDTRVYGAKSGFEVGPQDSAGPQTGEFNVLPNKWTQFWAFIDFDNNRLAYWVGDQDRPAVNILDFVSFDWQQNYGSDYGFNQFWFEFNTSQKRNPDPVVHTHGRHLAVLRNVADPAALVSGFTAVRPNPPTLN